MFAVVPVYFFPHPCLAWYYSPWVPGLQVLPPPQHDGILQCPPKPSEHQHNHLYPSQNNQHAYHPLLHQWGTPYPWLNGPWPPPPNYLQDAKDHVSKEGNRKLEPEEKAKESTSTPAPLEPKGVAPTPPTNPPRATNEQNTRPVVTKSSREDAQNTPYNRAPPGPNVNEDLDIRRSEDPSKRLERTALPTPFGMSDFVTLFNQIAQHEPSPVLCFKPVSTYGVSTQSKHGRLVDAALTDFFGPPVEPGHFQRAVQMDSQKSNLLQTAIDVHGEWSTLPLRMTLLPLCHNGRWTVVQYLLDRDGGRDTLTLAVVHFIEREPRLHARSFRSRSLRTRELDTSEALLIKDYECLSELLHADRRRCIHHKLRKHCTDRGRLNGRDLMREPFSAIRQQIRFSTNSPARIYRVGSPSEAAWTEHRAMAVMLVLLHGPHLVPATIQDVMKEVDDRAIESAIDGLSQLRGLPVRQQIDGAAAIQSELTHRYRTR